MQEAHIIWGITCERYPEAEPPQRTALYKRSLQNRIHDLSRKVTRQGHVSISALAQPTDTEEADAWDRVMGGEGEVSTFFAALQFAPALIRDALSVYLDDDLLVQLRAPYELRDGKRETTAERICKLLGLPATTDVPGQLRAFLRDQQTR